MSYVLDAHGQDVSVDNDDRRTELLYDFIHPSRPPLHACVLIIINVHLWTEAPELHSFH